MQAIRDGSLAWKPRVHRHLELEAPGMPGLVATASGIVSKARSGDRLGKMAPAGPTLVRWADLNSAERRVGRSTRHPGACRACLRQSMTLRQQRQEPVALQLTPEPRQPSTHRPSHQQTGKASLAGIRSAEAPSFASAWLVQPERRPGLTRLRHRRLSTLSQTHRLDPAHVALEAKLLYVVAQHEASLT